MREEHAPPKKDMWLFPGQLLEPFEEGGIDLACTKLLDELVVVDRKLLAVCRHLSLNIPGCNNLVLGMTPFRCWCNCWGVHVSQEE